MSIRRSVKVMLRASIHGLLYQVRLRRQRSGTPSAFSVVLDQVEAAYLTQSDPIIKATLNALRSGSDELSIGLFSTTVSDAVEGAVLAPFVGCSNAPFVLCSGMTFGVFSDNGSPALSFSPAPCPVSATASIVRFATLYLPIAGR